ATNCILAGNNATFGGAVYSTAVAAAGDFENCTVAYNSPDAFNGYTGVLHDSILYFDSVGSNEIIAGPVAPPQVSYCDVEGANYAGAANENLSVDPQFTNTASFYLSSLSPLIDA